jgi:hypothetical protein
MPRYRFHIFNDIQTMDGDGKELPDLEAARVNAIQGARGIMADELQTKGHINLTHWIEIEDEHGDMTVVTFGDAVTVQHKAS